VDRRGDAKAADERNAPGVALVAAPLRFAEILRDVSLRFSGPRKCASRNVLETRTGSDGIHTVLYQRERVRCGKKGCPCTTATGRLHGPYWYAYWKVGGRTRKKYIGKDFRELAPASLSLAQNDDLVDALLDELVVGEK
jgi:hypothetical protein